MYHVKKEFNEQIVKNARYIHAYFVCKGKTYKPLEFQIESKIVVNDVFVGSFIAKSGTIKTDFKDNLNLENQDIDIYVGVKMDNAQSGLLPSSTLYPSTSLYPMHSINEIEYVHMGTYRVYEVTSDTQYKIADKRILFNKTFKASGIKYPITVRQLLLMVCSEVGVTWTGREVPNLDLEIPLELFFGHEAQCSKVIEAIAQATCSVARITRNNKLDLKWFDEVDFTIVQSNETKFVETVDKYGPINSLVLAREPQNDNVYSQDEESIKKNGLCELKIVNNPILDVDRYVSKNDYFNFVKGFEYIPFTLDTQGFPHLDSLDVINIKKRDGTEFKALVMDHVVTYKGGLTSKFSTPALTKTQIDYAAANDVASKIMNVEFIVDKQNGVIQGIVDEVSSLGNKQSQFEMDLENINLSVEEVNNHNIIYNFNGEEGLDKWIYSQAGLLPSMSLLPSTTLYPRSTTTATCVVRTYSNSLSGTGFYFTTPGTAITSDYTRVVQGSDKYSFMCKRTEGTARFAVRIYEYDKDKKAIKDTIILDSVNPKTYESASITLQATTEFVKLQIISYDKPFGLAECMFNRGNPRHWSKSPDNVYQYSKSEIQLLNDQIALRVTADEMNSELKLLSDQISLKVEKDGIISSINQSAEQVTIKASKISFEGLVTANSNFKILTDGSIEAKNAKFSGSITSSTINVNDNFIVNADGTMNAKNGTFTGVVTATSGKIGNFTLSGGAMNFTSPEYERGYSYADLSAIKDIILSGRTPTAYEKHIYDTNASGTITTIDYIAIKNYLLGQAAKPKKTMIKAQVIVGNVAGEITTNVLYNGSTVGLSSKLTADKATLGVVDVKGLSIDNKSVEPDGNGFLKLV